MLCFRGLRSSQSSGIKAGVKQDVFRDLLKPDSLLHDKMSAGRLYQITGAAYENERL